MTQNVPKIQNGSFWFPGIECQVVCTLYSQVVTVILWDFLSSPLIRPNTMVSYVHVIRAMNTKTGRALLTTLCNAILQNSSGENAIQVWPADHKSCLQLHRVKDW